MQQKYQNEIHKFNFFSNLLISLALNQKHVHFDRLWFLVFKSEALAFCLGRSEPLSCSGALKMTRL